MIVPVALSWQGSISNTVFQMKAKGPSEPLFLTTVLYFPSHWLGLSHWVAHMSSEAPLSLGTDHSGKRQDPGDQ